MEIKVILILINCTTRYSHLLQPGLKCTFYTDGCRDKRSQDNFERDHEPTIIHNLIGTKF